MELLFGSNNNQKEKILSIPVFLDFGGRFQEFRNSWSVQRIQG